MQKLISSSKHSNGNVIEAGNYLHPAVYGTANGYKMFIPHSIYTGEWTRNLVSVPAE